ncbi:crotonobetainyl-CoA:carnitine CoA-transferase CaiB-like acyl-CoA transferase [Constrictibacter sp. MBR-5]|jgi:crotonobetainyl-CoA:carnitine CoA-transferase CaiB-like acyl-CoA transferase|uniref:CaiB/BaiF CoA transferase family protein n=1 Tax=Constrictibacter sp. MBR-5 TaxID=3156467 RepID=UPI0033935685
MPGPFAGLRVVDLTAVIVGPYASQFLGDMGADVVKVEPPEGDLARMAGPSRNPGMASHWIQTNRNKRDMVLDLKTAAGAEALRRLIRTADVFVHNMREEPLKRLGFDYDNVRALKPDIVYCNILGFGRKGRYAGQAAYDDVIQGASGLVALEAFGGRPARYVPMLIADKTAALFAAYGIAAALYHKLATGEGQEVEVPMFESMVSFTMLEHLWGSSFEPPLTPPGSDRHAKPERWPFATEDGHICVLPTSNRHWDGVFAAAGREDLKADARFVDRKTRMANRPFVNAELERIMATRTTAYWAKALAEAGVPCMPISSLDEVMTDGHLDDVGFWHLADHPTEGQIRLMNPPVRLSRTPAEIRTLPARFGEHTRAMLAELGYGEAEIDAMIATGAAKAETP